MDTELARLVEALPATDTTIIVMGDNGTAEQSIRPPLSPLRGKGTTFEGGVRVPLIITGPAVRTPGQESSALAHIVDVLPTVAELAGVDLDMVQDEQGRPHDFDGVSLVPWLEEPDAPSGRPYLFAEGFSPNGPGPYSMGSKTIRDDRFKLRRVGREEFLYELDGGRLDEGPNLLTPDASDDVQAIAATLSAALDEQLARIQPAGP